MQRIIHNLNNLSNMLFLLCNIHRFSIPKCLVPIICTIMFCYMDNIDFCRRSWLCWYVLFKWYMYDGLLWDCAVVVVDTWCWNPLQLTVLAHPYPLPHQPHVFHSLPVITLICIQHNNMADIYMPTSYIKVFNSHLNPYS